MIRRMPRWGLMAVLAAAALGAAMVRMPVAEAAPLNIPINHVIVVYQENWSFDSLYGKFPGANGLASAAGKIAQVDAKGTPITVTPQPWDTNAKPAGFDARFPANLPVAPFDLTQYTKATDKTGDIVHRFYTEQEQIDGGKMDKFMAWSDNPGLVLSYFDATNMPEGRIAQQYVLADNFFHAAFGGSFLNHQFLICACAPTYKNAPAAIVSKLDATGHPAADAQPGKSSSGDGAITPDGFAVNTIQTVNTPHAASITDTALLLPNQTAPTIGDRMDAAKVSWAWYSGGWNDAVAGKPDPLFQFHHQPFAYYANYADGTPGKALHLKDEKDFFSALQNGSLPAVSFVKPLGPDNEHPGYADLARGQQHVADIVSAVQNSPFWKDTAIVITYDEHGGRWDHVAPPVVDKWGPGIRVPTIIVSPYAKAGFVDHTQYDTASILKFIEARWDLAPLGTRDAAATNLLNAFDFTQTPRVAPAPAKTGSAGLAGKVTDATAGWAALLALTLAVAVAGGRALTARRR